MPELETTTPTAVTTPRCGLLLINLGTPDSPAVHDVRRYLKQFLWDARVLDIPAWRRWLVLNLFILPFRPRQSAEAYHSIWTERGSPLLLHTQTLASKVQALLGEQVHVEIAMRYGNPSIDSALQRLRKAGIDRIVAFPLYPQYASAATGSSVEALLRAAQQAWNTPFLQIVPPFYQHPAFIEAFAEQARATFRPDQVQRVLFSFHGLPERQVKKSDDTGAHCLIRSECCAELGLANRNCYRAHCVATARALSQALGIDAQQSVICFQSRLGRTPWVKPYTDEVLKDLAQQGIKRIAVLSPAFVADCLETVEELGMRGREDWLRAGGTDYFLVPCPNASDTWARGIVQIAQESSAWIK